MQDRRILIIGASGTGCSTLGEILSDKLSISFFDGDDYYWLDTDPPYKLKRDLADKQQMLKKDLDKVDSWIFSGSPESWAPFILEMITHVVFIYLPWEVRKERIIQREAKRFGERILEGGDMYESHKDFLKWSQGYDTNNVGGRTLYRHTTLIGSIDKPIFTVDIDENVGVIVEALTEFLK